MSEVKVIEERYSSDLTEMINHYLKMGWRVQGGVSVHVRNGNNAYYTVLMVK